MFLIFYYFILLKFYSNLEKEIHVSDDQLTIAIKNNEKLNYNLEHSDSLFNITFQNYINQLDIEYKLIFLRENKVILKTTCIIYS